MAEQVPERHSSSATALVGRARELEALRALLASAAAGRGRLAVVTGAAGIGKTTLVGEIVAAAGQGGFQTLRGGCYDGLTTAPYEPWFEALTYQRDLLTLRSYDLIGYVAEALPDAQPVDDERTLAQAVHRLLAHAGRDRPVLLVLEDLHWADTATVELLLRIAPVVARLPLLVVATWRDEEASLRQFPAPLISLTRLPTCEWIALPPLADTDIDDWIAAQYGLAPQRRALLAAAVARFSEGNPLFAQEIVRELEQTRRLRREGDGWLLGDLSDLTVPPVVQQLIRQRLTALADSTREVLNICAVLGQVFPTAVLEAVSGDGAEDLSTSLAGARDALILNGTSSPTELEFRHSLTREVIYQDVPAPQRRALHLRAAEALLRSSHPVPDQVSAHLVEAGDGRAVEWLLRAGDLAERSHAWSDAVQRYERALEALAGGPESERLRGWLHFRIGCLLRYRELERARHEIDEAIASAHAARDAVLLAYGRYVGGVIDVFAKSWQRGISELLEAIRLLEDLPADDRLRLNASQGIFNPDALPLPTSRFELPRAPEPPARLLLGDIDRRATVASLLAESGRLDEALEMTLLDGDTRLNDAIKTGHMLQTSAFVHALAGRSTASEADYERAERTFLAEGRTLMAADCVVSRMIVLSWPYLADRPAVRADQRAQLARFGNSLGGVLSPEAITDLWLVYTHFLEGRWDLVGALVGAQERESLTGRHREHVCWVAALLARERSEPDVAWSWLDAILPDSWRVEPGNTDYLSGTRAMLLAAELALDAGNLEAAERWLALHDRWRAWSGAVLGAADAELGQARLARMRDDLAAAQTHALRALALAVEPRQPLAQIGAQRVLATLDIEAANFASARERIDRAVNLATACNVPREVLACRAIDVQLRLAEGEIQFATELAREVRDEAETMTATRLLARLGATEPATRSGEDALTERELEVLRVVARGQTDAEVAEELFIGTRTVNAHMRSIRAKLGVDSRMRAVQAAQARGLI